MPSLLTTKEKIAFYSKRIVEAQRPIRILDSIKWPSQIQETLIKSKFKEVPRIQPEDYEFKSPLSFDPEAKKSELSEIVKDIEKDFGKKHAIGSLLSVTAQQYIKVVSMLQNRGKNEFGKLSEELYGSPRDKFFDDETTVSKLGETLYQILTKIDHLKIGPDFPEDLTAHDAVKILNERFKVYFGEEDVRAKISDGIIADAAAGGDTVKVRADAMFSQQELDLLEVHEGWVHVGTTLNGNSQKVAQWLSKGPPRVASTQEGLAVIMEIFTFRSFPKRAKQINDRVIGVEKVIQGANVIEMAEFYRTEGYNEKEVLYNLKRIFRGAPLVGGAAFTKDISYCKGFIENYNFMRAAIKFGKPELLPFLFVGKVHCDDVPLLYQAYKEGIVEAPKFLPPQFRDLNGLSVWMSFSNFLNILNLQKVHDHYERVFGKTL